MGKEGKKLKVHEEDGMDKKWTYEAESSSGQEETAW
jgi:hypothetical protein